MLQQTAVYIRSIAACFQILEAHLRLRNFTRNVNTQNEGYQPGLSMSMKYLKAPQVFLISIYACLIIVPMEKHKSVFLP